MNQKNKRTAVAVSYSSGGLAAPVVSAKGQGVIADAIVRQAMQYGVPLQEDKALVELLSKIELNHQIPPELYQVVAEVLASVYRMEKRARSKGEQT
ncbi:EscU/YscU/HrcU family type III secretion system export apparatus switch protein [Ammoniphilus sp. YIM 78166]|uniref:EscU/YscU/HrcU family type III secretion system export apparatus switch protein n=1 Tax=Ammoniphilus sp. YIM 78166 TaxID=1644106 RepID=UPI00106F379F|nr:EscU/YscU/HrcU family type III secretion system export apparatus switch protein [Ammoniphilus sp. YIM 78166]